ncbi:hypothetical protein [Romboutsia lituseburensis]|uniref:hypothetical protein n=1 Tax=Romboutsia lituseburensis TaxID=1537 RepID=UPI00215B48EE|nr:hypothetical protein [Romboutsia lituseburensis]MCR8746012.1 hypothetical protein [Romboutsia lituseburensis]
MASKRKFKRDYIILEAKDTNFRYKERILPKAFAKVEINDEKSIVSLYVENLKCVKDGYRVVAIQSDYETLDLGKVVLSEQGKGEFVLNLDRDDVEIKGIALLYEKSVPLIGFKGSKIENYEEILFTGEDEYEEDEYEEYEEIEYIEIDDADDIQEYEEIEYIEIDDDSEYEEIEDEYEEDDEYIEISDDEVEYECDEECEEEYEEYDNVEETIERNISQQNHTNAQQPKQKQPPRKNTALNKQKKLNYDPQNKYTNTSQESKTNLKTAGVLLMPRQIKKGLKYFNEVKPFVTRDVDDTRWWKIEISPTTLCGYTMPYLGYVNSLNYTMYSDAVMQSYKYRHYLFGVQYDEYNKRKHYIYAVPGHKNEQPDKGHTGFTTYQPCDTRNDSLGYWLCFIDSRTRRITK